MHLVTKKWCYLHFSFLFAFFSQCFTPFYNEVLDWLMWHLRVSRKNLIKKSGDWHWVWEIILQDRQQRRKYQDSDDWRLFLRPSPCQTLNILTPVKENKEGSILKKGIGTPVCSEDDSFFLFRYLMHNPVLLSTVQSFDEQRLTVIRTQMVLLLKVFIYLDSTQTRYEALFNFPNVIRFLRVIAMLLGWLKLF